MDTILEDSRPRFTPRTLGVKNSCLSISRGILHSPIVLPRQFPAPVIQSDGPRADPSVIKTCKATLGCQMVGDAENPCPFFDF